MPIVATMALDADLDNDGFLDVVYAQPYGVGVLLGLGDGRFVSSFVLEFDDQEPQIRDIAVDDLNGDGRADLLFTRSGVFPRAQGTVSVMLGQADGSLSAPVSYSSGIATINITTGDWNRDGDTDVAVTNGGSGKIEEPMAGVLFGRGDGSLSRPRSYPLAGKPRDITAADVNLDGAVDLVTSQFPATVSVLLNDGRGAFSLPLTSKGPESPRALAAADLTGDGVPDLAIVANQAIALLAGVGDGLFVATGATPVSGLRIDSILVPRDLDDDGDIDLAVSGDFCTNGGVEHCVGVVRNEGGGVLSSVELHLAGFSPTTVAVGDFTQDETLDLLVPDSRPTLTVIRGNRDGGLDAAPITPMPGDTGSIAVGDVTGDGVPDLVIADPIEDTNAISVLRGLGGGAFDDPVEHQAGNRPVDIELADLDNDGDLDIVSPFDLGQRDVAVLLNSGDGSFDPPDFLTVVGGARDASVTDMNGDGVLDVVVTSWDADVLLVFIGTGDATFWPPAVYETPNLPSPVATGDINGDGAPDVVVGVATFNVTSPPDEAAIFLNLNDGLGSLGPPTILEGPGDGAPFPLLVDLDLDGDLDLILTHRDADEMSIEARLNDGSGVFTDPVFYEPNPAPPEQSYRPRAGDVNGDQRADLIVSNAIRSDFTVFLGDGQGGLVQQGVYTGFATAVADLDQDGDNDIVGGFGFQGFTLHFNEGCPFGDLDGDGVVGPGDLGVLLAAWGPCDDCGTCPADLDGDCVTGPSDLAGLLAAWDPS